MLEYIFYAARMPNKKNTNPSRTKSDNDNQVPSNCEKTLWADTIDQLLNHPTPKSHRNQTPNTITPIPSTMASLPTQFPDNIAPLNGSHSLAFCQPGLSLRQLNKIFKHPFTPDITIDLHHQTRQEAYLTCQQMLLKCHWKNQRKCRVICGKGHHQQGQSKMKSVAVFVLKHTDFVLAYQSAHPQSGGTGAIDIYLKKKPC